MIAQSQSSSSSDLETPEVAAARLVRPRARFHQPAHTDRLPALADRVS